MKKITFISLVCLINFWLVNSQEVFEAKKVNLNQKDSINLDGLLKAYTVLEFDLEQFNENINGKETSNPTLYVDENNIYNMTLFPKDIRSPNYKAVYSSSQGIEELNKSKNSITYRGSLANGKFVRITSTRDFLYGVINTAKGLLVIDQLKYVLDNKEIPNNYIILYYLNDSKIQDGFCPTNKKQKKDKTPISSERITTSCQILEVATDADFEYFQNHGNNSNNRILGEFNNIQGVYANTLNIEIVIVFQNVWTTVSDPYSSTNGTIINNEISSTWQNTFGNIDQDLVHHFTGKNLGGLLGQASDIGTVCSNDISTSFTVDANLSNSYTVAHEIGHNLGAEHPTGDPNSFCSGTALQRTVMCQGANIPRIVFSNFSENQINNYLASNSACLFQFENIEIVGESLICDSNNRTYNLVTPLNGNITWHINNQNASIVSGQGTSEVIISPTGNGSVELRADIEINGTVCGTESISKTLHLGTPYVALDSYCSDFYSSTCFLNSSGIQSSFYSGEIIGLKLIGLGTEGFGFDDPDWEWERVYGNFKFVAYGPSGNGNPQNNGEKSIGSFANLQMNGTGNIQFKGRARNECGWGAWKYFIWDISVNSYYSYSFYPNPASSQIIIEKIDKVDPINISSKSSEEEGSIIFYNFNGAEVKAEKYDLKSSSYTIDVSDLKEGNYFMKIGKGKEEETHQIIIRH